MVTSLSLFVIIKVKSFREDRVDMDVIVMLLITCLYQPLHVA